VLMETMEPMVKGANRAQPVVCPTGQTLCQRLHLRQLNEARPVLLVSLEMQAKEAIPVNKAEMEIAAFQASQVNRASLDSRVKMEMPDRGEMLDEMRMSGREALLVTLDNVDFLVKAVRPVIKDNKVDLVIQAIQVSLVHKVVQVIMDLLVNEVHLVSRAHPELRLT